VNPRLKHLAERALVAGGIARLARERRRGAALVLAYHNIVPTGAQPAGDASLHLPQSDFARQLDALRKTHDVVALPSLLDENAPSDSPRVAITFDDAYAGALRAGVEELALRGMPATIFVAPGLLGIETWWDVLAPRGDVVPEDIRKHALWQLGGKRDSVLSWRGRPGIPMATNQSLPRIGTAAELASAGARRGITLGSHSWAHPNLCALSPEELERELSMPLEWLRARFASVVPFLSYPYGLHSTAVEEAAARAGYRGAFLVDGSWLPAKSNRSHYALPRFNVPAGLSLDGFRLRVAGIGLR
jgi:peptidoglycan/xylan/chitin deacetylase (PgdA/CDA1 family)